MCYYLRRRWASGESISARLLGVLYFSWFVATTACLNSQCFYKLRQLRCVRRSLDQDSIATLFHAFVSSRVDYCCSLLTGCPKFVMDKFQKVLNAAARVITNSRKYERGLTYTRRHELHWLDIPERIQFRIAVTVHRCLNGLAPAYRTELCTPVTQNRSSCRLRSSYCHRLAVPSVKLSIGSRSFSVSGPSVWNALPDYLRNPTLPIDVFKSYFKTFLFARY